MEQSQPVHAILRSVFYKGVQGIPGLRYVLLQIDLVRSEVNICTDQSLLRPLDGESRLPALWSHLDDLRLSDAHLYSHILISVPYINVTR